ncbi:pseudouridine synthase [Sorangium sp. So ce513]|uniref:pseudouridine synthase n=1 Tax=Sorangium sp. So ce513 TaxID=3133315 RepID=UPI003F63B238
MSAARWRVGPSDGPTVADVLERMGGASRGFAGAAAEGRAFLNARRARPDDVVAEGDELAVWPARREVPGGPPVEVLARWGEILVAFKPAALPTAPERRGTRSLITEVAELLGLSAPPHAASRLDVGVSGAVLCATGARGQRHLAAMREAGRVARVYVGVAGGRVEGSGTWDAPIGAARARGGRSLPAVGGAGARDAVTRYQAIAWAGGGAAAATLLRLEPVTGRMHQLRVHAAHAGAPLLGDRDHGGARSVTTARGRVIPLPRIALHALRVAVPDERGEERVAVAPVPDDLRDLWAALDGDGSAWEEVLSAAPEAASLLGAPSGTR